MNNKCTGLSGFVFGHHFKPFIVKRDRGISLNAHDLPPETLIKIINETQGSSIYKTKCKRCGMEPKVK